MFLMAECDCVIDEVAKIVEIFENLCPSQDIIKRSIKYYTCFYFNANCVFPIFLVTNGLSFTIKSY